MKIRDFPRILILIGIVLIIGIGLTSYFGLVKPTQKIPSSSVTSTPQQNNNATPTMSSEQPTEAETMECQVDTDCSCGVSTVSNNCAYGNKQFIDSSPAKQCPDYCTGIAGHLRVKCVANTCTQVQIPR